MKIGIMGSGNMGLALGTIWAQEGHEVLFTLPRHEERLTQRLQQAGPAARATSVDEALTTCDVFMVAVLYPELSGVLQQMNTLRDKLVLTCVSGLTPDMSGQRMGLPTDRTLSVAEEVQNLLPDCSVFEAFNLTFAEVIDSPARQRNNPPITVAFCGDGDEHRELVKQLIWDAHYNPFDAGALRQARSLETLATLWVQFAVVTNTFPAVGIQIQVFDLLSTVRQ
jgi:8-hydroxy-5-deazaflavin:NADPH oxidoreductase